MGDMGGWGGGGGSVSSHMERNWRIGAFSPRGGYRTHLRPDKMIVKKIEMERNGVCVFFEHVTHIIQGTLRAMKHIS